MMMKISDRELVGRAFRDIWPEEVRPAIDTSVRRVLKGQRSDFTTYRMNGNQQGWWNVSLSPLFDDNGVVNRFIAISTDITKRVQMEEALLESEQKYKNIVNNIAMGIAVISPTMEILSLNEQMKKWFPQAGVLDKPICFKTLNIPPRETICPYCVTRLTMKDGQVHETITETPVGNEMIHYRIISSPIFDKDGRVIASIEMVEDITRFRRAQLAVEESENKFKNLSEKSLVGIYLIQGDIFRYVNPKLAEIFGYEVNELTGIKGPVDLVVVDDWPTVRGNIVSRETGEVEALHYEFRGQKKNGDVLFIEAYGSKTSYNGQPAVIGTLLDITDRKKAVEERERLIDELQEAMATIKTLQGVLPICSSCKKIRDDNGRWKHIEIYIREHSSAEFSHGLCPDCLKKMYPDMYDKMYPND